uniref:Cytochrome b-c1 complex subunit 9 n=1 Tax=Steinernema glaseri TaxID=37863 RepID=A0A1I7YR46_9BILA
MRLLPVLCCLVASAYCFSIDGLKGKELWKTVSNMSPEDIDEVARIIAENREKVGDRMRKEHAAIYEQNRLAIDKTKKYVKHEPHKYAVEATCRHLWIGSPMHLLPVLCCLVASAYCFSIDGLKGKELWKTVSNMSPEDIDEVARIIAENSEKVGDRMRKEHAAIYEQNRLAIDKAKES